ncbi:hypothetical protein LHK_02816 [Laribacter hongkongensis HLHK9]|uniref:Uncharacterized protein n=1 Tax=Laribacter hongkongensis (strain HLHK9) TaxID=557598 RepID=C1DDG4_LARHH|nr:hypothetical protein LHK_02816 [Laribacter hongkongensis HLHK9]
MANEARPIRTGFGSGSHCAVAGVLQVCHGPDGNSGTGQRWAMFLPERALGSRAGRGSVWLAVPVWARKP